jgi:hypothetical protein
LGFAAVHESGSGIVLQNDFANPSVQDRFNIGRQCALSIQKFMRPDSIVSNFYLSTASARRLLQQYRHKADAASATTNRRLSLRGPPEGPMRTIVASALAIGLATTARAEDQTGMFLCQSPMNAVSFWDGLIAIRSLGTVPTRKQMEGIARKWKCAFVASGSIKPIQYAVGTLLLTDGRVRGYAAPDYYIAYLNQLDQ